MRPSAVCDSGTRPRWRRARLGLESVSTVFTGGRLGAAYREAGVAVEDQRAAAVLGEVEDVIQRARRRPRPSPRLSRRSHRIPHSPDLRWSDGTSEMCGLRQPSARAHRAAASLRGSRPPLAPGAPPRGSAGIRDRGRHPRGLCAGGSPAGRHQARPPAANHLPMGLRGRGLPGRRHQRARVQRPAEPRWDRPCAALSCKGGGRLGLAAPRRGPSPRPSPRGRGGRRGGKGAAGLGLAEPPILDPGIGAVGGVHRGLHVHHGWIAEEVV
jgi:hypothetical protein